MRHKLSGRQLSRNSSHRHALLRNMAVAVLRYETIRTTVAKAKELRRVVEPLITLGKIDTQANRRLAFARLRDPVVVDKLFGDLGPRFRVRPGGYTRILRMGPRAGDSAPMALMQLVDRPAPVAVNADAGDATKNAKGGKPAKSKASRKSSGAASDNAAAKTDAKVEAKAAGKAAKAAAKSAKAAAKSAKADAAAAKAGAKAAAKTDKAAGKAKAKVK